jgi:hypothetical protein
MLKGALKPAGSDPIMKLALETATRPFLGVFLVVVLVGTVPLALSALEGNFVNPRLTCDGFGDLGWHTSFLILLPFVLLFARYYLNDFGDALERLHATGAVKPSDDGDAAFVAYAQGVFRARALTLLPPLVGLSVAVFAAETFNLAGRNTWNSPPAGSPLSPAALASMVAPFFLYYLLSAYLLRLIAVFFVIRRFLATEVNLQPLHPDKCGGLSPLGQFSLRITKAGVVVGLVCLLGIYSNVYRMGFELFAPVNVLIICAYVFGLAVAFFLPLLPARRAMQRAKSSQLQEISNRFQALLEHNMSVMRQDPQHAELDLRRLEETQKLYDIANAMPVYPFNFENVVRFSGSVLWPILFMGLERLIE